MQQPAVQQPIVHIVRGRRTSYFRSRRFIVPDAVPPTADLATVLAAVPPRGGAPKDRRFLVSLDAVPEAWTNRIAAVLGPLIRPAVHFHLLALALALAVALPFAVEHQAHASAAAFMRYGDTGAGGGARLWVFLALLALMVFHEFGHAAACRRLGIRADGLGMGFFLLFPAFFTKMSLIALLDRRERVIVYTSGVYFQALGSIALALWAAQAHDRTYLTIVHLNNLTIFLNLLPVLRFDGFKIIDELAGSDRRFKDNAAIKACALIVTLAYLAHVVRASLAGITATLHDVAAGRWNMLDLAFAVLGAVGLTLFACALPRFVRAPLG